MFTSHICDCVSGEGLRSRPTSARDSGNFRVLIIQRLRELLSRSHMTRHGLSELETGYVIELLELPGQRVDFQSMHSIRRAGVWPPLLGLRFFLCPRESNRRAGRLIASAGAAGQRVAETGQPSFELQRPPMPPLLLWRRMVVMCDSSHHQLGRGRPWPALIDGHDIHSQQGRAAAGEAWLAAHLRAKCPGSRVLHGSDILAQL